MSRLEFDRESIPWLDKYYLEIDAYVGALGERVPAYDLREKLIHWLRFGYVTFPGAVSDDLIDAYLADVDDLFADHRSHHVHVNVEGIGITKICEVERDDLDNPHARIMDFHNSSVTGKLLALHPTVVDFLSHVFRDTPVAMQTLTFLRGTEQSLHQDFPYVVSEIPSHLAASWIALEDVHPDAGPLGYYAGSHTIGKFDWGNGMFFTPESTYDPEDFADHLHGEVERVGLPYQKFLPKKGDLFVWHASLAHEGTAVDDRSLTRKSLVTHYSSKTAYTTDRRAPKEEPVVFEYNGGLVFADPTNLAEEDVFPARGTEASRESARQEGRVPTLRRARERLFGR